MRKGEDLPAVRDRLTLREALAQLRKMRRRSGAIVVTDARGRLAGVFTDADLRRLLEAGREDALDRPICDVMTRRPKFVRVGASAAEAIALVNRYFIEEIPVVDDADRVVGLVDVQDLFAEGVGL